MGMRWRAMGWKCKDECVGVSSEGMEMNGCEVSCGRMIGGGRYGTMSRMGVEL